MGMFDEILVKQELEIPDELKGLHDWKNHQFQTKDLDNSLSLYIINEYKELVEKRTEREYISYTEEERKKLKLSPWNLWKEVIEGETTYINTNYHGVLNFYTYEHLNDQEDFSLEYNAYFVYGKLDKIELLKFEKSENYLINNEKIRKQMEEEKKKPWNRLKGFLNLLGWRWFWRRIERSIYKLEKSLGTLRMFLIRHF
jgi:hypothetical protein